MTERVEQSGTAAGATTASGPLGRIDPVPPDSALPGAATAVVRAPLGSATVTVVIGFFVLIATLVVLGALAERVRSQQIFTMDAWATPFLHSLASPGMDTVMNLLTDFGSTLVIIPVFVVVAALLFSQHRNGAILYMTVVALGALVINGTMKVFVQRPRPAVPWAAVLPDYSFPSGHTMNAVVFWVALALIAWSIAGRRIGMASLTGAALIALGVGISRIYLGFHYLTDVVGGVLAGIAWLLVVGAALRARPAWQQWRHPASPVPGTHIGPTQEVLK